MDSYLQAALHLRSVEKRGPGTGTVYRPCIYVVVFMNEVEIFKSSLGKINLKLNSSAAVSSPAAEVFDYTWEEDSVTVSVPLDVGLHACLMRLDVYTMETSTDSDTLSSPAAPHVLVGSVALQGQQLRHLLGATAYCSQLFDIVPPATSSQLDLLQQHSVLTPPCTTSWYSVGDMKLSGRPAAVLDTLPFTPITKIPTTSFFVSNLNTTTQAGAKNEFEGSSNIILVYWNGREIFRDFLSTTLRVDGTISLPVVGEGNNRPFKKCSLLFVVKSLKMTLSLIAKTGADLKPRDLSDTTPCTVVGLREIANMELLSLLAKAPKNNGDDTSNRVTINSLTGKSRIDLSIQINSTLPPPPVQQEFQTVYLDILSCCGLRLVDGGGTHRRPNAFVKVFWRSVFIGRTTYCLDSSVPIFSDQRFVISLERFDELKMNKRYEKMSGMLKLEVWSLPEVSSSSDRSSGSNSSSGLRPPDVFLGCVELSGHEIYRLVNEREQLTNNDNRVASVSWKDLMEDPSMKISEQVNVRGQIKVRLGCKGCVDSATIKEECLLHVAHAHGLREVDVFDKTNAIVIVYWNNDEVGRTKIVARDVNPVWNEVS